MKEMLEEAKRCAEIIKKKENVCLVSHIDADGLTSAGIMCMALERCGIEYETIFLKQLDEQSLEDIADRGKEVVVFTDLGSGMIDKIVRYDFTAIVADHHRPSTFMGRYHVNPHLFGMDGAHDLSGSGTSYLLANFMGNNRDLADIAIVGAVGDLQDRRNRMLEGFNREILREGKEIGVIEYEKDLRLYGKQTRPVYRMLQYTFDPYLPGISGDEKSSIDFLRSLGIPIHEENWRRWIDLTKEEKKKVVSGLAQLLLSYGLEPERLIGEVYTLTREEEGTEVRDASEYATLLNATARYNHEDVGLAICMGDRGHLYKKALNLLREHRKNLSEGVNFVKENGMITLKNIQYFNAGDRIKETIVGIVAGMSFENRNMPIIAFADSENGLKVSARGTQNLVRKGLNLAQAIKECAERVGGSGGGHNIAAGATIPKNSLDEFLSLLDRKIGEQLGREN
ncbi:MAG: DHHA1 domain-containing protein [Candidatus Syntropharchaeia archaeon]